MISRRLIVGLLASVAAAPFGAALAHDEPHGDHAESAHEAQSHAHEEHGPELSHILIGLGVIAALTGAGVLAVRARRGGAKERDDA